MTMGGKYERRCKCTSLNDNLRETDLVKKEREGWTKTTREKHVHERRLLSRRKAAAAVWVSPPQRIK